MLQLFLEKGLTMLCLDFASLLVQLIDHDDKDPDNELLPVSMDAASVHDVPGAKRKRPLARTRAVCLAPTGRAWAAATTEGLLVYALDEGRSRDSGGWGGGEGGCTAARDAVIAAAWRISVISKSCHPDNPIALGICVHIIVTLCKW